MGLALMSKHKFAAKTVQASLKKIIIVNAQKMLPKLSKARTQAANT